MGRSEIYIDNRGRTSHRPVEEPYRTGCVVPAPEGTPAPEPKTPIRDFFRKDDVIIALIVLFSLFIGLPVFFLVGKLTIKFWAHVFNVLGV